MYLMCKDVAYIIYLMKDHGFCVFVCVFVSNLCLNLKDNDKFCELHALSLQLSSIFQSSINPQCKGRV